MRNRSRHIRMRERPPCWHLLSLLLFDYVYCILWFSYKNVGSERETGFVINKISGVHWFCVAALAVSEGKASLPNRLLKRCKVIQHQCLSVLHGLS